MKKLLIALCLLFYSTFAYADGSVTIEPGYGDDSTFTIKFVCVGDASDGDVPDTDTDSQTYLGEPFTKFIQGMHLYEVRAYAGATAPTDDTDIFLFMYLDEDTKIDLLGSVDNSTAYAGLNLLENTGALGRATLPDLYNKRAGEHFTHYWKITGKIELSVSSDQAVNNATWTVEAVFVK